MIRGCGDTALAYIEASRRLAARMLRLYARAQGLPGRRRPGRPAAPAADRERLPDLDVPGSDRRGGQAAAARARGRLGGHGPGATGRLPRTAGPDGRRGLAGCPGHPGRAAGLLRLAAHPVDRRAAAPGPDRGGRAVQPDASLLDRGLRLPGPGDGGRAAGPVPDRRGRTSRGGAGMGPREGPGSGLPGRYGRPEQVAAWRDGQPYVAELADNSAGR